MIIKGNTAFGEIHVVLNAEAQSMLDSLSITQRSKVHDHIVARLRTEGMLLARKLLNEESLREFLKFSPNSSADERVETSLGSMQRSTQRLD